MKAHTSIYMYMCLVLLCCHSLVSTAVIKLPLYKTTENRSKRETGQQSIKRDTLIAAKLSHNQLHHHEDNNHLDQPSANSVPAIIDIPNLSVYTFITVGTPPTTFKVALATENSSSNLWVLSEDCKNVGCSLHIKYNHRLSTTYVKNGSHYDDGLSSGYLSKDTVTIAGLTVVGQVFGEAVETSTFDILGVSDGVLGLGLQPFAKTGTSLFFNLLKQNLIQESVFGIYLVPWIGSSAHLDKISAGEVILGGRDPDHYMGELMYTPLTNNEHWMFKMNTVSIKAKLNDTITPVGCQGGCGAVIDSMELFIIGPKKELEEINKKLGAVNPDPDDSFLYYFDCSAIKTLPTLLFYIGGKEFELSAEHYVLNLDNEICLSVFFGDYTSQWALGAPFLEAVYTEFDVGNKRLGFAPAKY